LVYGDHACPQITFGEHHIHDMVSQDTDVASIAVLLEARGMMTARDGAGMLQCVPRHEKSRDRCSLPRFTYGSKQQMAQVDDSCYHTLETTSHTGGVLCSTASRRGFVILLRQEIFVHCALCVSIRKFWPYARILCSPCRRPKIVAPC